MEPVISNYNPDDVTVMVDGKRLEMFTDDFVTCQPGCARVSLLGVSDSVPFLLNLCEQNKTVDLSISVSLYKGSERVECLDVDGSYKVVYLKHTLSASSFPEVQFAFIKQNKEN